MDALAERLTKLREKNKLSQTDVAKMLGSTPALISAYENGDRKPSLNKLQSLADIYHTTTDYILGRTNTSETDKILLDVTHLSANQIKLLRELVKDMGRS